MQDAMASPTSDLLRELEELRKDTQTMRRLLDRATLLLPSDGFIRHEVTAELKRMGEARKQEGGK